MLNGVIKQIEKGKPFFDKIAQNIYLGAVRDGFLTAMPAILFSKCIYSSCIDSRNLWNCITSYSI